jgi:hypothetical protein
MSTTENGTKTSFWAKTWQTLRAPDEAVDYNPLEALRRRMDLLERKMKGQMAGNPANNGEQP